MAFKHKEGSMVRKKKQTGVTKAKRLKPLFVKPSGIRVEDIKPGTIFSFVMNNIKEIHLALSSKYDRREGASLNTWLLSGHDMAPCADLLPGQVSWDYKIEILGTLDAEGMVKKLLRSGKKHKVEKN